MRGFTFDHEIRMKLAKAAVKYLEDDCNRTPLNGFIMEVQAPFVKTITEMDNLIKGLQSQLKEATKKRENI